MLRFMAGQGSLLPHRGAELWVETREGEDGHFGLGRKEAMTFREFLDRMAKGDKRLYLTTQQVALTSST